MSRPRGWLGDWRPQRKTLLLIEQIQVVLQEYAAHLPLTVRQIFYRLVGAYGYDKTELAYDRLGEVAAKARRASLIPMDHIRDDGITRLGGHGWASKGALFDNWRQQARHFRLDRQAGQPTQLYLWCEAAGMAPQLERVADPYDVTVLSGGGFDSLTMKHDLAAEFSREGEVMVLHIGDHDPSGVHVLSGIGCLSRKNCPEGPPSGSVASHTVVSTPSSTLRCSSGERVRTQPGSTELTSTFVPCSS